MALAALHEGIEDFLVGPWWAEQQAIRDRYCTDEAEQHAAEEALWVCVSRAPSTLVASPRRGYEGESLNVEVVSGSDDSADLRP
jgi:hypothetical protein